MLSDYRRDHGNYEVKLQLSDDIIGHTLTHKVRLNRYRLRLHLSPQWRTVLLSPQRRPISCSGRHEEGEKHGT